MDFKESNNYFWGTVITIVIVLIGGSYYLGTTNNKSNLAERTITPTQVFVPTPSQTTTPTTTNKVEQQKCQLPPVWGEVQFIYKLCNLKQVEQSTGLTDAFSFKGGNGSFNYCNSLVWRKYTSDAGVLYTYEKIRYQHYPNSEVGEYRAPEVLYNEITNGRPCVPTTEGEDNDNDISAGAFPSRNQTIETYEPDYWASFFNRHYNEYHWGN